MFKNTAFPVDLKKIDGKYHGGAIALVLFIFCLTCYSNFFQNGFMIDDYDFIDGKYSAEYKTLSDFFTKTQSQHFIPVYYLVNIPLFHYFEGRPWVIHLFNFILFYLNCLLLNYFIFLLTKDRKLSLLTSLLFCIHPINTNVLNQNTCNFVLIYGLFLQLSFYSFWFYNDQGKRMSYIFFVTAIFFILSLLSFEGPLLFPLYLASALFFLRKWNLVKILRTCLPFLGISLLYLFFWFLVASSKTGLLDKIRFLHLKWSHYFASLFYLMQWYVSNLIYPQNIVLIKNIQPIRELSWIWNILFFATLLGIGGTLFFLKQHNIKRFALSWFLIGFLLVPISTFAHGYMGMVIDPHWFFFSSMGFFLLLASLLLELRKIISFYLWRAVLIILILYFGIATRFYNAISKTEESYCHFWLKSCPDNAIPLMALGTHYSIKKEFKEALVYYQKILDLTEYEPYKVHYNIGTDYAETNDLAKAKIHIEEAIRLNPFSSRSYNTLGTIFVKELDYSQAEKKFLHSIELDPTFSLPIYNLTDLYIITKQESKAVDFLEGILQNNPFYKIKRNILSQLAILYFKEKNFDKSFEKIESILKEDSSAPNIIALSQNFEKEGFIKMAQHLAEIALKMYPQDKEIYLFYGVLLANQDSYTQAISIWERGYSLDRKDQRFGNYIKIAQDLVRNKMDFKRRTP